MVDKNISFDSAARSIMLGAFLSLIVLIALRVEYYHYMGFRSNMGPQIAYFFSPVLFVIVMMVGLPIEAAFRKFWVGPRSKLHAVYFGVCYTTSLIWWAFPNHWYLFIVINPLITRWIVGLAIRSHDKNDEK